MENQPSKEKPPIVAVCAYCKDEERDHPQKVKIDGLWVDACPLPGTNQSHGICNKCIPRIRKEWGLTQYSKASDQPPPI
jgi:hypothetical protein